MQKEQFYSALDDPKVGLIPIREELVNLSNAYPWFGVSHILLCKADHLAGHVAFDANLKRAAVYAGEREALFDLIHKESFTAKIRAFEEEIEQVQELELSRGTHEDQEAHEDQEEHVQAQEVERELLYEAEATQVLEELPESDLHLEQEQEVAEWLEKVDDGDEVAETELAERKKLDDFDELQREILLEAITSTIEQEVQDDLPKSEPEKEDTHVEIELETNQKSSLEEKKSLSSFAQFLQKRSREIEWETTQGGEKNQELKESEVNDSITNASPEALIDRFIAADPKITPKKSTLFSNENLAKMSLVEDEQFVTETMAKIYAKQGATAKAIKAYKLLSLKYPEKSIYFANQIKKLQERRKSTK